MERSSAQKKRRRRRRRDTYDEVVEHVGEAVVGRYEGAEVEAAEGLLDDVVLVRGVEHCPLRGSDRRLDSREGGG